jgi:hypothetical protein
MEHDLVVKRPLIRNGIRPRVRERCRRPIPPQLEHRDVALNRHAPGRHSHDFLAQKDSLAIVQELHGSPQCRAFGFFH